MGCVFDPSQRVPSTREEEEKEAAREAFASSLTKRLADKKIFSSSGSDRKHLPSDRDPRSEGQFEAGSATDRKPGDGTFSHRTSRSSAPHDKTSSGHQSSRSQDARGSEPLQLTSRGAAGKDKTSTKETSDHGSAARQFDERRLKSMRVHPDGQDDQPYTLLLDFRNRAVA